MITPEQIQHVRELLIQACDQHLANGGTIITYWKSDSGGRCPLGCLLGDKIDSLWKICEANKILGLWEFDPELHHFIFAFDGHTSVSGLSPLQDLGLELRAKYLGK
jgi:hypothetical protein